MPNRGDKVNCNTLCKSSVQLCEYHTRSIYLKLERLVMRCGAGVMLKYILRVGAVTAVKNLKLANCTPNSDCSHCPPIGI